MIFTGAALPLLLSSAVLHGAAGQAPPAPQVQEQYRQPQSQQLQQLPPAAIAPALLPLTDGPPDVDSGVPSYGSAADVATGQRQPPPQAAIHGPGQPHSHQYLPEFGMPGPAFPPGLQQAPRIPPYAVNAPQYPPNGAFPGSPAKAVSDNSGPKYTQQVPKSDGLTPGEVFGLITESDNPSVDGETVVIYQDSTLGIREPNSPGYLFESVLFPEYDLLIVPEPLGTVKLNDKNVYFVNQSLFNPTTIFQAEGWKLKALGGKSVVCPSWNSVIVYVDDGDAPPCADAVDVNLTIIPITLGE